MLFKIKTYIQFLLKATNQHGVHSPFVYTLVTKCFYDRKNKPVYKQLKPIFASGANTVFSYRYAKLIHRLTNYLHIKNILVSPALPVIQYTMFLQEHKINIDTTLTPKKQYDMYLLHPSQYAGSAKKLVFEIVPHLHNNSVILCPNIRATQKHLDFWHQLIALDTISVSIDLFNIGLLFIRKEQVKENFKIRLWG
ncbi:hypothetical protein AB832_01485 [Flavobacteriaceae bacterium (ex Bugula neritina AB1)]|nr:hypothetical protein AB832_01485 [Flavobacteriaceae bacterium (ex Bugula neritina AB1)]